MKTLKLSARGGSALSGKKLILCIAIAIMAGVFLLANVAFAADVNWALSGTPSFQLLHAPSGTSPFGSVANINDDDENTGAGVNYGSNYMATVHYQCEVTLNSAESVVLNEVEYVVGYWMSSSFFQPDTYARTSLYYDGQWHNIDNFDLNHGDNWKGTRTITNGAPWYGVSKVKIEIKVTSYRDWSGIPLWFSVGSGLYELRAWGSWINTLSGHAWDKDSNPVIDATITIDSTVLGAPIELITDSSGYYEKNQLMPGTYTVTGTHPSYSFMPQEVTIEGIDVDVSFYTIFGYIRRHELGGVSGPEAGINGINVLITGESSPILLTTGNDSQSNPGYYEKQGVGNGTYTIEAQNP